MQHYELGMAHIVVIHLLTQNTGDGYEQNKN